MVRSHGALNEERTRSRDNRRLLKIIRVPADHPSPKLGLHIDVAQHVSGRLRFGLEWRLPHRRAKTASAKNRSGNRMAERAKLNFYGDTLRPDP